MLSADSNPLQADVLVDKRVSHYWDADHLLGRFIWKVLDNDDDGAAWDVFLVYGPGATWGDPPDVAGTPVIAETARLERALQPYLRDS